MSGYSAAGPPRRRPAMSLKPTPIQPVPEETARVARGCLPQGQPSAQPARRARRHLRRRRLRRPVPQARPAGAAAVAAGAGHPPAVPREPARPAGRRGGAGADRLEVPARARAGRPGFDHSVLCEFRSRLLAGSAEERLLHKLLEACQARGLLKARGRQRTDATHVAGRPSGRSTGSSWSARPCARP